MNSSCFYLRRNGIFTSTDEFSCVCIFTPCGIISQITSLSKKNVAFCETFVTEIRLFKSFIIILYTNINIRIAVTKNYLYLIISSTSSCTFVQGFIIDGSHFPQEMHCLYFFFAIFIAFNSSPYFNILS